MSIFFRPANNLNKYGSWALVTGATDGIGKALAFELARKGQNLILIGRNIGKLNDVTTQIQSKYEKVRIKNVVVDFSGNLKEGIKKISEAIEGLDGGVLINNALQRSHTQAVIAGMIKRKRGAIINVGSGVATVLPSDPLYAVYAATKAYIDEFSKCLHVEYKKSGIDVQCQAPLYVATKIASMKRSSFFVPSSTGYARAALLWIGREPRCTPYWTHSLIWNLIYLLPESAVDSYRFKFYHSMLVMFKWMIEHLEMRESPISYVQLGSLLSGLSRHSLLPVLKDITESL